MIEQAPFHQLPGDPLSPGSAFWVKAEDDIRLRLALWRCEGIDPVGGVLLFPGRTEYIEKYAPFARKLTDAGYEVLAIDWRGQGLSDRLLDDPRPGHIREFKDYQRDVIEMVVAASQVDLPKPWHLLAHSMGGCIGLAALFDELPVSSAVFSAPMWGIEPHGIPRPVALAVTSLAKRLGLGERPTPGTGAKGTYFLDEAFGSNLLTGDLGEWTRLLHEAAAWPDLTIGGASFQWLGEALRECARLSALPSPDLPVTVSVGDKEKIVSSQAIRDRAGRWDDSRLLEFEDCRHEVVMEVPDLRNRFLEATLQQFDVARQRIVA
ncbi:alpha/beta fold hydrolase [Paracoccus saliphilus]|uniref:Lysophospholipase n=1 Tax=Paracoccus saliphilus TaxID=405559 RepID=A0AA45W2W4_9RHOB|nr:alpha/beta hydrolase [Paracoccus saliphilus]SIS71057.1 lysophospholipase [Paracoccus saliphilus]